MDSKFELAITQTQINTLQSLISRMSNYSLNCKTWAVTLITGMIVVLLDSTKIGYYWISLIPLCLFFLLDCYYLGLEKAFRDIYIEFMTGLASKSDIESLLIFSLKKRRFVSFLKAFISMSTTPFYLLILVSILAVKFVLTGSMF